MFLNIVREHVKEIPMLTLFSQLNFLVHLDPDPQSER